MGAPAEGGRPRFACLWVPLFSLAARLRSEPELIEEAAAVFEGDGPAARLIGATRRGRRGGLRRGMTPAQARALIPDLAVRGRDPLGERAARQALIEVAESCSPRVEDAAPGEVYLDVRGLDRMWPGEDPERALGDELARRAGRAGLPARVGIASGKLAARIAAEGPDSPTVVADGEEHRFLAPLPLARLCRESEVHETLARWGLESIGDFARLPRHEVASRLGETGRALHRSARGLDSEPLVPTPPAPVFREGLELDWPLGSLEPFLFTVRAALERLCRRLESTALACSELEIELALEPDGRHHRRFRLPGPSRDVKTLLTLLRLDLEARPPGAPVIAFELVAHPDRARAAQLTLFGPEALSPDRLATTLARLFSILGRGRAGSPAVADSHRPEAFTLVDYSPPPPPEVREAPPPPRGLLAVRALRPPVPLEVLGGERPHEVHTPPRDETAGRPRLEGAVRVASGPWRIEADWWLDEPVRRDYWDVELAAGGLYRIYRDRATGDWFADGIYD